MLTRTLELITLNSTQMASVLSKELLEYWQSLAHIFHFLCLVASWDRISMSEYREMRFATSQINAYVTVVCLSVTFWCCHFFINTYRCTSLFFLHVVICGFMHVCIVFFCPCFLLSLLCNCSPVSHHSSFSSAALWTVSPPSLSMGNFDAQRQMKCLFVEVIQTRTAKSSFRNKCQLWDTGVFKNQAVELCTKTCRL